ncbi:hypothetical protein PQO03_17465 [Lentisphaera profundi]|uniref:Uncharacterized protein n=1 Tax=Lentisphaera profundi TaxID=1658616 RepID=A0ABY7VWH5_9BACT|nr:hypothetical protein [Lentisphaera profundi]WDE97619.1 hypothetical protein PQO03_17465 [Lentisphaera profundi]
MKFFYYVLGISAVLINVLQAQTVLVDHSSENPDDLWSMGAADVMSFYLQEQGLEVVHRDQLNSMINELSIADAKIANTDIRKGQWKGAEFIVTGTILESKKGLFLKVGVHQRGNGAQLYTYQKSYEDKDSLASEVESQARHIARILLKNQIKKKNPNKKDEINYFRGVNALTLMHYYRAVQLMQSNRETEAIVEFIYLTQRAPSFELPYYWLISFFEKCDLNHLARAYRNVLSVEGLKASQLQLKTKKRIFLRLSESVSSEQVADLYSVLFKAGFTLVDSESIEKSEQEGDLQKWGFVNNHKAISQLEQYASSYAINLESENDELIVSLRRTRDGKLLMSHSYSELQKTHFEALKSALLTGHTSKEENSEDKSLSSVSHLQSVYKNKRYLLRDVLEDIKGGIEPEVKIFILVNDFREEFENFKVALWQDLFAQNKSDLAYYYECQFLYQKHGLNGVRMEDDEVTRNVFYHMGKGYLRYREKKYAAYMEDILKIKKDVPIKAKFTFKYNQSFDDFKRQKWEEAKSTFLESEKFLHRADFKHQSTKDHIQASLYEMLVLCDQKMKRPASPEIEAWLKTYKQQWRKVYIKEFLTPYVISGINYFKKGGTDDYAWHVNKPKVNIHQSRIELSYLQEEQKELLTWPMFPQKFNIETYKLCEQYVDLYTALVKMPEKQKWQHERFSTFLKAVSHLTVRVDYHLNKNRENAILAVVPRLNISQQAKLLSMMGKYDRAEELIYLSKNKGNTYYFSSLSRLKGKTLSRVQFYQFEKGAYSSTQKGKEMRPSSLYSLYKDALDERDFVFADKLIKDLAKQKQRDQTWQYSHEVGISFMKAELLRRQGESFVALSAFRKLQKQLWKTAPAYCFVSNVEKLVHERLLYLETVPQQYNSPSSWKVKRIYTINDRTPEGEKVNCLDHLNTEQRKLFDKIYKILYFRDSLSSSWVMKNGGNDFIKKFGASAIPALMKILDNDKRTWRQEFITETLLEKLALAENEIIFLEAFQRDFQYLDLALKANPKKAAIILQRNAWVFAGEVLLIPLRVLDYKIENLYPEVYAQCLKLNSNYAQNFEKLRKNLVSSSQEQKEQLRLVLRKALVLHKAIEMNSFHERYVNSLAKTAFMSGEIDGLRLLIDSSQLASSHRSYLVTPELMKIVRASTKDLNINTLRTLQELMYLLQWDYKSMKWYLSEQTLKDKAVIELIASDKKIATKDLDTVHRNLDILDLNKWTIESSETKMSDQNPFNQNNPYIDICDGSIKCRFRENGPGKVSSFWIKPGNASLVFYPIKHGEKFDKYQLKEKYKLRKNLVKGHEMSVSVVKPLNFLIRSYAKPNKIVLLHPEKISDKKYQLTYKIFNLKEK